MKKKKKGCKNICGAPTTLAVKGQMTMIMNPSIILYGWTTSFRVAPSRALSCTAGCLHLGSTKPSIIP